MEAYNNIQDRAIETHIDDAEHSRHHHKKRRLSLILLVCINLLNYADRFTLSGVLPVLGDHTKSGLDHDLDDTEQGLLQTVFVVTFMIFAPIFGKIYLLTL